MRVSLALLAIVAQALAQQTTTYIDFTATASSTSFFKTPVDASSINSEGSSVGTDTVSETVSVPESIETSTAKISSQTPPVLSSSSAVGYWNSSSIIQPTGVTDLSTNSDERTTVLEINLSQQSETTSSSAPDVISSSARITSSSASSAPAVSSTQEAESISPEEASSSSQEPQISSSTQDEETASSEPEISFSSSLAESSPASAIVSTTSSSTIPTSTPSTSTSTSPATSSSAAPTSDLSDIEQAVLERHNYYRSLHNTPALTWNNDLKSYAQSYIDSLRNTDLDTCSGVLEHSSRTGLDYGENLAYGTITGTQAVDLWYEEIDYYNINDPAESTADFEAWGHFTQLVWKSSTQLGCVIQQCSETRIYVICEYSPQGNIFLSGGDPYYFFKQNVLPLA